MNLSNLKRFTKSGDPLPTASKDAAHEIQDIKVAVRCRPFSQREIESEAECVVSMSGQTTIVACSPEKKYTFNYGFWSHDEENEDATQEAVTGELASHIVGNTLSGYNGCVLAYGQTGAGKTYSMIGLPDAPGIVPTLGKSFFPSEDDDKKNRLYVSYLEIYNDAVRDLLSPSTSASDLTVVEHPVLGMYVQDLTEEVCVSEDDLDALLDFASKKRAVTATQMNGVSSRSHTIVCIRVQTCEEVDGDMVPQMVSKINLVDLAGNERMAKDFSKLAKDQIESSSINQSLSTLSLVVRELMGCNGKGEYLDKIPFRTSKLTWYLKDSLAANSKTFMLAAISPAGDSISETLMTLQFAEWVKSIKTSAVVNVVNEIAVALREEIAVLSAEGSKLAGSASTNLSFAKVALDKIEMSHEQHLEKVAESQEARENFVNNLGLIGPPEENDSLPLLLNMADDPSLAGCLVYYLEAGETSVGKGEECLIKLNGIGIPDVLCNILNEEDTNITIFKHSSAGRIVVNGAIVDNASITRRYEEGIQLEPNDMIFFGRVFGFKLLVPLKMEPEEFDEAFKDVQSLLLEGKFNEWAAIDESPTWTLIEEELQNAKGVMDPEESQQFEDNVRKACDTCDLANDLTKEVFGDEYNMQFVVGLQPPTDNTMPAAFVFGVRGAAEGSPGSDAMPAMPEHFFCSLDQMKERVDLMQEQHEMRYRGNMAQKLPLNPWDDISPFAVRCQLSQLELQLEQAHSEVVQLNHEKFTALSQTLMMWQDKEELGIARLLLQCWWHEVRQSKPESKKNGGEVDEVTERDETADKSRSTSDVETPQKDQSQTAQAEEQKRPAEGAGAQISEQALLDLQEKISQEFTEKLREIEGTMYGQIEGMMQQSCESIVQNLDLKLAKIASAAPIADDHHKQTSKQLEQLESAVAKVGEDILRVLEHQVQKAAEPSPKEDTTTEALSAIRQELAQAAREQAEIGAECKELQQETLQWVQKTKTIKMSESSLQGMKDIVQEGILSMKLDADDLKHTVLEKVEELLSRRQDSPTGSESESWDLPGTLKTALVSIQNGLSSQGILLVGQDFENVKDVLESALKKLQKDVLANKTSANDEEVVKQIENLAEMVTRTLEENTAMWEKSDDRLEDLKSHIDDVTDKLREQLKNIFEMWDALQASTDASLEAAEELVQAASRDAANAQQQSSDDNIDDTMFSRSRKQRGNGWNSVIDNLKGKMEDLEDEIEDWRDGLQWFAKAKHVSNQQQSSIRRPTDVQESFLSSLDSPKSTSQQQSKAGSSHASVQTSAPSAPSKNQADHRIARRATHDGAATKSKDETPRQKADNAQRSMMWCIAEGQVDEEDDNVDESPATTQVWGNKPTQMNDTLQQLRKSATDIRKYSKQVKAPHGVLSRVSFKDADASSENASGEKKKERRLVKQRSTIE